MCFKKREETKAMENDCVDIIERWSTRVGIVDNILKNQYSVENSEVIDDMKMLVATLLNDCQAYFENAVKRDENVKSSEIRKKTVCMFNAICLLTPTFVFGSDTNIVSAMSAVKEDLLEHNNFYRLMSSYNHMDIDYEKYGYTSLGSIEMRWNSLSEDEQSKIIEFLKDRVKEDFED